MGVSGKSGRRNDYLAAQLNVSLYSHAVLKPMGIAVMPSGEDPAKADEYLAAAVMLFESSDGAFPHYGPQTNSTNPLNYIDVFRPAVPGDAPRACDVADKSEQMQAAEHHELVPPPT